MNKKKRKERKEKKKTQPMETEEEPLLRLSRVSWLPGKILQKCVCECGWVEGVKRRTNQAEIMTQSTLETG